MRLVGHFGTAWRNFTKFHGSGTALRKNLDLHQIGTIGAAIALLVYTWLIGFHYSKAVVSILVLLSVKHL